MRYPLLFVAAISHFAAAGVPEKVVSLAPHLTEWVYSLDSEASLVAVSEASDYPPAAKNLPRVADYRGANIADIMALAPDLILAWQGGNRLQDISRLQSMGYEVFLSAPKVPGDIAKEMKQLGRRLGKQALAEKVTGQYLNDMENIRQTWKDANAMSVFYYMWTSPLMTIGPDAWASHLLSYCHATTLFNDSPVDYPEVSLQEVLRRQPDSLVAATSQSEKAQSEFWRAHRSVLTAPVIMADPDITSRFTLRLPEALGPLCEDLHEQNRVQ